MTPRPLILIVDDNIDNVRVLGAILGDEHEIQFATSGAEALKLVQAHPPELILLDIMMPGMDGKEVFAQLQRNPLTKTIPVVFVTALSDPEYELEALASGASDFLAKPVNPGIVRARVRLQIRLARYQNQLESLVQQRTLELAKERDRAQSSSRAKSAFLANLNHELRTPLGQVIGFANILARKYPEPYLQDKLAKIQGSAQVLLRLIEDLIDIARIESQEVVVRPTGFEVRELLVQTLERHSTVALQKGLVLRQECASVVPAVLTGDPQCLRKVLDHLISNAVKFSDRGTISVRVDAVERHADWLRCRFEVEDQGIGIGDDIGEHIFTLFTQGDDSPTRRFGGTGLGLTVCKRLISLMGGHLEYASRLGEGSRFAFTLKMQTGTAAQALSGWPGSVVDWQAVSQAALQLQAMLAQDDFTAVVLYEESLARLQPLLGSKTAEFVRLMDGFDLEGARNLLLAAIAECPDVGPLT